jgi:hypothetical protein
VPLTGLYVCAATKSLYWGLAYPSIIAAITFIVGSITLKETRDVRIWDELEALRVKDPEAAAKASGISPGDAPTAPAT